MRPSTRERRAELYHDALTAIQLHCGDHGLSLGAVAHEIACSRRQLQRVLAEYGATSFHTELTRARMERAAALLQEGSRSVSEVATAVGYRHGPQFAKMFRSHHGITPSSFRAQFATSDGYAVGAGRFEPATAHA